MPQPPRGASGPAGRLTDVTVELLARLLVQRHLVRGHAHPADEQRAVRLLRVRVGVRVRLRLRVRLRVRVRVRVRVRLRVRVRVRLGVTCCPVLASSRLAASATQRSTAHSSVAREGGAPCAWG